MAHDRHSKARAEAPGRQGEIQRKVKTTDSRLRLLFFCPDAMENPNLPSDKNRSRLSVSVSGVFWRKAFEYRRFLRYSRGNHFHKENFASIYPACKRPDIFGPENNLLTAVRYDSFHAPTDKGYGFRSITATLLIGASTS